MAGMVTGVDTPPRGHDQAMAGMAPPPLPQLREELLLHPAPPDQDGSPAWTLADPTRNRFYRINWMAFEILARWPEGSIPQIVQRIEQETTLAISHDEVFEVAQFLASNHLLRPVHPEESRKLAQFAMTQKGHWLRWLLHHYLFFRIPLAQPDRFLNKTLPWVAPLFSKTFAWFIMGAGVMACFLLLRQWDSFQATLMTHLEMAGLLSYGITLMGVKSVHELGHAYTAKRYGCRVPTMGVAFLVLLPMLYTDTTEAWKLPHKKQRLAIVLGGIATEGALAVLALLAWNLLPPGTTKEMAFWMATTSLSTTLAINLSPFMRFDGYFVLSDWLDQPNLHERAFQMGRWRLREALFGLHAPPPESVSPALHRFLILFALGTWLYRLILFLGIAVLVYHFFIKLVGILLFMVEIGWFIALPIWREIKLWPGLRLSAHFPWRLPLLLIGFLVVLLAPWSSTVTAPALLQGEEMIHLYVPEAARLERMPVSRQGSIQQGEVLFVLNSPDLKRQQKLAMLRMSHSEWEMASAGLDTGWARRARIAHDERERTATTLAGLKATEAHLILTAPFAGEIMDVPPDLAEGVWLGTGAHLATLVNRTRLTVDAYLNEEALGRVQPGARGRFIPEVAEYPHLKVYLKQTDAFVVAELGEPLLASIHGGPIAVLNQQGVIVPEAALFRVRLQAETIPGWSPLRLRGTIHVEAKPQSLLERWSKTALMVLVREWEM
ncbi:MAG: HlyD family efflux transporter periplasmic adaptor subunit [Magnetococcus sp. YQC-5]